MDERHAHQLLAKSCLRLLTASLKEDILGVRFPGTLATNIYTDRLEHCLPSELQYACLYWAQHAQNGCMELRDDEVHQFLNVHLLHWLKVLGWIGSISTYQALGYYQFR